MSLTVTDDATRGRMVRFMQAYIQDTLMVNTDATFYNKIYYDDADSVFNYVSKVP